MSPLTVSRGRTPQRMTVQDFLVTFDRPAISSSRKLFHEKFALVKIPFFLTVLSIQASYLLSFSLLSFTSAMKLNELLPRDSTK